MNCKVIFQNTRLLVRQHTEYYITKNEKLLDVEETVQSLVNGLYVNLMGKYKIEGHLVVDIYNFERENFDCAAYTFPATIELELYSKPKDLKDWKQLAREIISSVNALAEQEIDVEEELNNIKFYEV